MTKIIPKVSSEQSLDQQYSSQHEPLATQSNLVGLDNAAELPLVLKKMLCTLASYYNGQLHRFVITDTGELALKQVTDTSEQKLNGLMLIVARPFYSEQARSYPIDNKKELKKLLALEANSSGCGDDLVFHHWHSTKVNEDKGNSQSQINLWQFSNEVPTAFLRLPETLLLALTCKKNQVLALITDSEMDGKGELYLTRSNSTVYSLTKTSVVNSVQRFAMSVGVAQSESTHVIAMKNLATQLAMGCKALTLPLIASFIQKPKVADRIQLLKNTAIPLLLVLGVYLAGSSAYLVYKEHSLQQQLANQSSDVSVALSQQVNVDKQLSRYQALQDFIATQRNTADLWLVMATLLPQAQFSNVRIIGERYVLRGEASKATDLLQLLFVNPAVQGAKFDFPVRKNRGRESFVISFKLLDVERLATIDNTLQSEQPPEKLIAKEADNDRT